MVKDDAALHGAPDRSYWVNTDTGEVEHGRRSGAGHRMGPYGTEAEARAAYDGAAARNETWEAEDEAWKDAWDDEKDDWDKDDDRRPGHAGGAAVP